MKFDALLSIRWSIDPELFNIGGFSLRYYSLCFVIAFYLGYWLMKNMYLKEGKPTEQLYPLLIYVLLGTVIGARLGQTLFYEFDYYRNHPLEIILPFKTGANGLEWTGYQGLASHGGAIGIIIALLLYARRYKTDFLFLVDRLVIVVALAGFFIRLGNLFNSEILGTRSDLPWAFIFEKVDLIPRHPAQLYEALAYLLIFIFLWKFYNNTLNHYTKGFLFGLFLVTVFTARFLVEFVKEDQEAFEQGWILNMGQLLSLPFIGIGVALILWALRQNRNEEALRKS